MRDALSRVFEWTRFLPDDDMELFVTEFMTVAGTVRGRRMLAPLVELILAWQDTAETWADSEAMGVLRHGATGDHGPVPAPGAAGMPSSPGEVAATHRRQFVEALAADEFPDYGDEEIRRQAWH